MKRTSWTLLPSLIAKLILASSLVVPGLRCVAQITFTPTQLPTNSGAYYREYVSSNSNPSSLIGPAGGPQVWDFSWAQQPGEIIRRIDIVPASDGGYQSTFPNATYGQRYTNEGGPVIEWDYYSIGAVGRLFYGSYNVQIGSPNTFTPAGLDLPATVGFGSNWSYNVGTTVEGITEVDSVSATVDAYGTLKLPQLGTVQALRVNQVTTVHEYISGFLLNTYYLREYYWLASGFEKAAHIVSQVTSAVPPANFNSAAEIRRVFASSSSTSLPTSISGFHLTVQAGVVSLSWNSISNVSSYQVLVKTNLAMTNWQVLGTPASNSFHDSAIGGQRFYRILTHP